MIDSEQIAATKTFRTSRHLFDRHATDGGSGNERTDARARVHTRFDAMLLERTENADMRKALHAAAAKNDCDALSTATAGLFSHRQLRSSINSFGSPSL